MIIELKNSKFQLRLDFTKYFSHKEERGVTPYKSDYVIKYRHKDMIKNLVDYYICYGTTCNMSINLLNPVKVVDKWFKEALTEELSPSEKTLLEKNYETFKKEYHLVEKKDKLIDTLNKVNKAIDDKATIIFKGEDNHTYFTNGQFILNYANSEGLKGANIENSRGIQIDNTSVVKVYNMYNNNCQYHFNVSVKDLKAYCKGEKASILNYVSLNGVIFNTSLVAKYLDATQPVEIHSSKAGANNVIVLKQKDRTIVLLSRKIGYYEDAPQVTPLENLKIGKNLII